MLNTIIGVFIGFWLTVLWDYYKSQKRSRKNKEILFDLLYNEIKKNIKIIKENKKTIKRENELILQENNIVLENLNYLENNSWALLKNNISQRRMNKKFIKHMKRITYKIENINNQIRNKSLYKTNFHFLEENNYDRLKGYNNMILYYSKKLKESLIDIEEELKNYKDNYKTS